MGFTEIRIGSVYDYAPLIGKQIGEIIANVREKHRTKTLNEFNQLLDHVVKTGDESIISDYDKARKLFPGLSRRGWEITRSYITTGPDTASETASASIPKTPDALLAEREKTGAVTPTANPEVDKKREESLSSSQEMLQRATKESDSVMDSLTRQTTTSSESAGGKKGVGKTLVNAGVSSGTATFMDEVIGDTREVQQRIRNENIRDTDPLIRKAGISEVSTVLSRMSDLYTNTPTLSDIQVPASFKNPRVRELYMQRSMQLRTGEIDRLRAANDVQQLRMAAALSQNAAMQTLLKSDSDLASAWNKAIQDRNTAELHALSQQMGAAISAVQATLQAAELKVRKDIAAQEKVFQLAALGVQRRANEIAAESASKDYLLKLDAKTFEQSMAKQEVLLKSLSQLSKDGVLGNEKYPVPNAMIRQLLHSHMQDELQRNPFAVLTWLQDTVGRDDAVSKFQTSVIREVLPDLVRDMDKFKGDPEKQQRVLSAWANQFIGVNGIRPDLLLSKELADKSTQQSSGSQELFQNLFTPETYAIGR